VRRLCAELCLSESYISDGDIDHFVSNVRTLTTVSTRPLAAEFSTAAVSFDADGVNEVFQVRSITSFLFLFLTLAF
jgi:hypothetical protein